MEGDNYEISFSRKKQFARLIRKKASFIQPVFLDSFPLHPVSFLLRVNAGRSCVSHFFCQLESFREWRDTSLYPRRKFEIYGWQSRENFHFQLGHGELIRSYGYLRKVSRPRNYLRGKRSASIVGIVRDRVFQFSLFIYSHSYSNLVSVTQQLRNVIDSQDFWAIVEALETNRIRMNRRMKEVEDEMENSDFRDIILY